MGTHPDLTWRILRHAPAPGPWNMAVDEAILEQVARGDSPPTLRLYAWAPPCLSLGRAQPASDVDQEALARLGWGLVRRPTGGRAILHTSELTYAVIARLHHPTMQGGVLESYQRISLALLKALDLLALPARADQKYEIPAGLRPDGPVCFEIPSNYEITAGGKKLVGSAQARRKDGVLQHGTLPLCGDLTRITAVLAFPDPFSRSQAAQSVLQHATTVESLLNRVVGWDEAANAFEIGFAQTFGLNLIHDELTPAEQSQAQILYAEKYDHPDWTHKI